MKVSYRKHHESAFCRSSDSSIQWGHKSEIAGVIRHLVRAWLTLRTRPPLMIYRAEFHRSTSNGTNIGRSTPKIGPLWFAFKVTLRRFLISVVFHSNWAYLVPFLRSGDIGISKENAIYFLLFLLYLSYCQNTVTPHRLKNHKDALYPGAEKVWWYA